MSDEARRSPFHDAAAAMGGSYAEDGGWLWLEGFGDVAREHAAIREDVAVWDVSPLNKWELRGPDALRAVQRAFSNDAAGLAVGQARYGALLDDDGLLVDDVTVFNTGHGDGRTDHCWVMTNGSEHEDFFTGLVAGLDAEFASVTAAMPHLGVIGPRSREVVQRLTDADLSTLRYFRFLPDPVRVGGVEVHLSRTGYGGELGYELFLLDPADATALWEAVVGAGVTPIGTDAIEVARIEAGLVIYGYDYEPHERTPYDLGLDKVVRLDQGLGFAGEDALRAVAAHPPRRFVTLRLGEGELPEYGATVTRDGEEVGVLTSPADSPAFGPIGLAVVDTAHAGVGTALAVDDLPATVDGLPLHDPEKKRPRA